MKPIIEQLVAELTGEAPISPAPHPPSRRVVFVCRKSEAAGKSGSIHVIVCFILKDPSGPEYYIFVVSLFTFGASHLWWEGWGGRVGALCIFLCWFSVRIAVVLVKLPCQHCRLNNLFLPKPSNV